MQNGEQMGEVFKVYQFFPDETSECVGEGLDARRAVELAADYCRRPAARIGIIRRVIITDSLDFTNFEWKFGEGIVFPKYLVAEKSNA